MPSLKLRRRRTARGELTPDRQFAKIAVAAIHSSGAAHYQWVTRMIRVFLLAIAVLFLGAPARAGEHNQTLSIGDAAPAWEKLPGTDDKEHSLADLKDFEAVVVVFTCNSCPVANDYEERIIALARQYEPDSKKVAVVAINVNRVPADSLEKMKERAAAKEYPFAYLYDESQQIAKDYGATFTPEFFVLDKERKVAYMGGMDDNSNASQVKRKFLEPALEAVLAGETPVAAETLARGCRIRYARERRKKDD